MSGKVLRTEETWEIAEDLVGEASAAAIVGDVRRWNRAASRYATALRFHSWPHEIPQEPHP